MNVPLSLIIAALGAAATVAGSLLAHVLKQNAQSNAQVLKTIGAIAEDLAEMKLTQKVYDVTLFGAQGDNGMASDVRQLKAGVSENTGEIRDLRSTVSQLKPAQLVHAGGA